MQRLAPFFHTFGWALLLAVGVPDTLLRADELEEGFITDAVKGRLLEGHLSGLETIDRDARDFIRRSMEAGKAAEIPDNVAAGEEMLRLLALERLPLVATDKLDEAMTGRWRVRSLQASALGCYAYPFFQCTIQREARVLVFHKHTGSQRRLGVLVPDGEDRLLFEGSSYYGYEDGPPGYSASLDQPTDEDRARDSVGYFYRIGEQRYLGVFLRTRFGVELYEIRK